MKPAWILPALLAGCGALGAQAPLAQEFRLPSGLRCVLLEKHDQPLVRVELATRWDSAEAFGTLPGTAGILAELLRRGGAGPLSRAEFNRSLDDLGIAFAFESRRNAYVWRMAVDSRSQGPAMELLANAIFRPDFDGPMVEALRLQREREEQVLALPGRAKVRFLWNLGDPKQEFPEGLGRFASLDFDGLQAFRRRVIRPEASVLVLHGDLNLVQAKELVHLHFGLWSPGPPPPFVAKAQAPEDRPGFLAVLDAAPDAELWAGREPGACPRAAAELLSLLLEQVPPVVAPGILRSCRLDPDGIFLVKVQAGSQAREGLPAALKATLAALRDRGFTQAEVDRARFRWRARVASLPLHPEDQVDRFIQGVLDPAFLAQVDAVGAREINEALAALLSPGSLRYLLLGGDTALAKGAEQAGFGQPVLMKN